MPLGVQAAARFGIVQDALIIFISVRLFSDFYHFGEHIGTWTEIFF